MEIDNETIESKTIENNSVDVGYSGQVSINYKLNGKDISRTSHNSGTVDLFKLLAAYICGYSIEKLLPVYIDVQDGSGKSILNRKLIIFSKTYGVVQDEITSEDKAYVDVSTTLFKEDIASGLSEDTNYSVALMSSVSKLASSPIGYAELSEIKDGYQGTIRWTLYFGNNSKQTK